MPEGAFGYGMFGAFIETVPALNSCTVERASHSASLRWLCYAGYATLNIGHIALGHRLLRGRRAVHNTEDDAPTMHCISTSQEHEKLQARCSSSARTVASATGIKFYQRIHEQTKYPTKLGYAGGSSSAH